MYPSRVILHIKTYMYIHIFFLNIQMKTYTLSYLIVSISDCSFEGIFFFYLDLIFDLIDIFTFNYILREHLLPRE